MKLEIVGFFRLQIWFRSVGRNPIQIRLTWDREMIHMYDVDK